MKRSTKTFIGGIILGSIVGLFLGGLTVAMVGATAFINYSLQQDKVCTTMQELTKTK